VCEPSQGAVEVVEVDAAEGWVSINIISTASINTLLVSIDEHPLWIYAVDGRHTLPQLVDAIVIPNGNRYSALVKLDKPIGDYTIRVATMGLNQLVSGFATLSYKGSKHNNTSTPFINYAGVNTTADVVFFDETKIVPFPPIAPAATADATHFLEIERFGESWKWTLSGKESYSLNLDTEVPLLFDPNQAEALNPNLTIVTKMGQWIDLVITSIPPLQPPHPLHKHSNKAFIIGAGPGAFNWSTTAEAMQEIPQFFNLVNPPYRDGFTTIPTSPTEPTWMVVRYQVVNPGKFSFSTHLDTFSNTTLLIFLLRSILIPLPHTDPPRGRNGCCTPGWRRCSSSGTPRVSGRERLPANWVRSLY
jgi:FtsP/CotA-like multicopper oxidase with cupredoxin domain